MANQTPKNPLYNRLHSISNDHELDSTVQDVLSIVQLILYKDKQFDLASLLEILGPDNFVKLLYTVGGQTITFPTPEEFKELFTWALTYYAKEVQGKDWKTLKTDLGYEESSIKWSSKNKQLTKYIQDILSRKMKGETLQEYLSRNIRP